jgi:hypothetical protein
MCVAVNRKELARRASNGIEVSLFWNSVSDRVTIEVADERTEEWFEFDVDAADALEAFNHPFAYAAKAWEVRSLAVVPESLAA